MPAENRKGPMRSPCCTPLVDQITSRPTNRGAGWKDCLTHGIMDGHWRSRACRMAGRVIESSAFFRSGVLQIHLQQEPFRAPV